MNKVKLITIAGVIAGLALAVPLYLLPAWTSGLTTTLLGQKITLTIASLYLILSIEAVLLFWAGLKGFKTQLRRAYLILCAAILMFAIAQIQVPLSTIPGLEWWVTTGFIALPYLLSSLLAFWGLRVFAHLLGIRDIFTQFRYVLPLIIGLMTISFFLPVTLSSVMPTAIAHHTFTAIALWELVLDGLASYNAWRIRQVMGSTYQRAMTWLFVTFFTYTLIHLHFLALQVIGYDNWYGRNSLMMLPLALVSLLLVKAGYEFWKVTAPSTAKSTSPLDIVMYTAGLATNVREISPIMDKVREITAGLSANDTLSEQNQKALAQVYLKLEAYLVEKEPLRTFTHQDIRRRIDQMLPHDLAQNAAFWSVLMQSKTG